MRKRMVFLFAAAAAVGALGCGSDEPTYDIASGALAGKHNGKAWKFVAGQTNSFLSDEDGFFTELYDVEFETCGFGQPTADRKLLLNVPTAEGEYELGLKTNVTFAFGEGENNVATEGLLVVEKVTADSVDVGVYAIFNQDPNFEVSGQFTATICPPE